ncbi:MAG: cbb3-type cytochrome oxidase assembly protein CcoS [Bacteroidia bacterium]|nr:cbb3-type cytochrome oxidase assembly protein CcoS [Bacteroidia bacterium]
MSVMYILIGCSIVIAICFLGAFLWSVRSGQYDDTYTPSVRMLFEETPDEEVASKEADPSQDLKFTNP